MLSFLILCYQGLEGCSIIIWGEGRGWHSSITNTPQICVRLIKHLLVASRRCNGPKSVRALWEVWTWVVSVDEVDWVSEEMPIPY